ncbi:MAG: tetratricopeptide repeat protein [Helicobacteraceae bacterium]|jgi:tetratricopeptide (TPR) repeat protein|nr:tetratricopeptide repeat protein [Helicobacteraceae bacterium]
MKSLLKNTAAICAAAVCVFGASELDEETKALIDAYRSIQERAITVDPSDATAHFQRANAYYAAGEYEKAIESYDQAIELDKNYANAYANRALVYHDQGKYEKAIADFDKAIAINPNYALAYNNRAVTYAAMNDYKAASKDAKKACELGVCKYFDILEAGGELRD